MSGYTPTNHQVYVAARIGYIGAHPDFIETKAQRDRAREYDEMIAEVVREAGARALEEAADAWHAEHSGTRPVPYNWLCARAAEIREGGAVT